MRSRTIVTRTYRGCVEDAMTALRQTGPPWRFVFQDIVKAATQPG